MENNRIAGGQTVKVIKKIGQSPIEFGDKVKLLANSKDGEVPKGTIGVAVSKEDDDGDVEVHSEANWDYINAANLEVLQKFSGESIGQATHVQVELTAAEVAYITSALRKQSFGTLRQEFEKLNAEVA